MMVAAVAVPRAEAQSVLRVAKGLASNNVHVFIDRAVVIESTVRFLEVSVANPKIADVSPLSDRSIYIFGRSRGVTSLTLLGEGGRLITSVVIKVEPDHTELKTRLKQLLPKEKIQVRTAAGQVILSGTVSGKVNLDRALTLARAYAGSGVTNMMTVGGTQQVMLKVKIAEMSRSAGKDLGVSLGLGGGNSVLSAAGVSGRNVRGTTRDEAATESNAGLVPSTFTNFVPGAGAFAGSFGAIFTIANSFLLDVQIDALEGKGFSKTLAEPNLITLSGKTATFLAGGEVPVPVRGTEGEISVEFKQVGVSLSFTPKVLDNELINIAVKTQVSEPDSALGSTASGLDVTGFRTRSANTVVELKDGQAFAIAGLLQEAFSDSVDQVPWLGDVPILGALFRSANYSRRNTELVIIVSVHLVTPVNNESDLALPTDRIRIPNESNLFLLGQTHEGSGDGSVPGLGLTGTGFDGDYGYVVE